jgi:hypothetical protein
VRRGAVVAVTGALALAGLPATAQSSPLAPVAAPAPTATAPAPVPADLQRLEQAMLAIPLTSERFTASVSVSAASGPPAGPLGGFARVRSGARTAASQSFITFSGEQSFSPRLASFRASFLGLTFEGRLIGTTTYLQEPFIASIDGGRPWVEEPNKGLESTVGVELGTLGGKPGTPATEAFGGLLEALHRASVIRELGPSTVDAQATTGFVATVDPTAVGSKGTAQTRALRKLVQRRAKLELFIAENGVPVRAILRLALREKHPRYHAELITQVDTLAINMPIAAVVAPPANKTITQVQLRRLEASLFAPRHKRRKHKSK